MQNENRLIANFIQGLKSAKGFITIYHQISDEEMSRFINSVHLKVINEGLRCKLVKYNGQLFLSKVTIEFKNARSIQGMQQYLFVINADFIDNEVLEYMAGRTQKDVFYNLRGDDMWRKQTNQLDIFSNQN